jgi:ketosteroid isomerase-like protein
VAEALAIANLKARYCSAADQAANDPEGARQAFRELFMPDVVADYGYGALSGIDAAAEFMCTTIPGNSEWMIHLLSSPDIQVAGESAHGRWTVMVQSKRREGGVIDTVVGRYTDEFRKTAEGWRIASVRFAQLV